MTAPYSVTWIDMRPNPVGRDFHEFTEALAYYRESQSTGVKASLQLLGEDAEYDGESWFDGLTDEERDSL